MKKNGVHCPGQIPCIQRHSLRGTIRFQPIKSVANISPFVKRSSQI
ncbi:MAG: hypothetical protein A4E62_02430 [Syntrophorhabdus sp. PtaU1.Bin002]|nr:MAG: hypothetical protein A4E62_02430 [Syntrophorhabdus sp. PtaU1.Bin002]